MIESDVTSRKDEGCCRGHGERRSGSIASWLETVAHGTGEVLVCDFRHFGK